MKVQPWEVKCPRCAAQPGQGCRAPHKVGRPDHQVRKDEAARLTAVAAEYERLIEQRRAEWADEGHGADDIALMVIEELVELGQVNA